MKTTSNYYSVTTNYKAVITKQELLEMVAKKLGRILPEDVYICADQLGGFSIFNKSYTLPREYTHDVFFTWNEEGTCI